MENKKSNILKNSMSYGAMLGMAMVIFSVILYVAEMNLDGGFIIQVINISIIVAGVVMGTMALRKEQGNVITYGRALGSGTLIVLFGSIISALYVFISMKFIDPGQIDKMIVMAEEQMLNQGIPEDQIELAMGYQRSFMTPGMMSIFSAIGLTFWGFVISLITSAFLKKRKSDAFSSAMEEIEDEPQDATPADDSAEDETKKETHE